MARSDERHRARGPFNPGIRAQGAIAGATCDFRPPPPAVLEPVRAIAAVCRRHGVAARQLPLGQPAIGPVIPGAPSRAEVLANAQALTLAIPADLWAELNQDGLLQPAVPLPGAA